jgi:hypothetical protein
MRARRMAARDSHDFAYCLTRSSDGRLVANLTAGGLPQFDF